MTVGFKTYFADNSNKIDFISFIWFTMYFVLMIIAPENPLCYYPTPENSDIDGELHLCAFILISRSIIAVLILLKVQMFLYVFPEYGILTELFSQCSKQIGPFFMLLLIWNIVFTFEYYILGVDYDLNSDYPNIPIFI